MTTCNILTRALTAGVLLVGLAGCASNPMTPDRYSGPVRVIAGDAPMGCTLVERIETSSGLVGLLGPQGAENARQTLLWQADRLGGTHVVWDKPVVGDRRTTLSAQVYRCPDAR